MANYMCIYIYIVCKLKLRRERKGNVEIKSKGYFLKFSAIEFECVKRKFEGKCRGWKRLKKLPVFEWLDVLKWLYLRNTILDSMVNFILRRLGRLIKEIYPLYLYKESWWVRGCQFCITIPWLYMFCW